MKINKGNQGSHAAILMIGLFFIALISGCATSKPADFVKSGFDFNAVDSMVLLPVLDHRIDQSKQLDLDERILPLAESLLEDAGYSCTVERDRSLILQISHDDLESPTQEFISSLPPISARRWILILVLDDSTSKLTFGSTGNAEMSGYLFDKESGELTWRNKVLSRAGAGGLIGMLFKGVMEETAITQATVEMFDAFPNR